MTSQFACAEHVGGESSFGGCLRKQDSLPFPGKQWDGALPNTGQLLFRQKKGQRRGSGA